MFPPVNGYGMNGTVIIPNASVMTIPLVITPLSIYHIPILHNANTNNQGNVSLNLELAGKSVGTTYLTDLTLKPGNNSVPMIGKVDQSTIISLLASKSSPYKDGIMPFDITGNATSTYNGKELPYFSKALAANKLSIKLDIKSALSEAGVDITL